MPTDPDPAAPGGNAPADPAANSAAPAAGPDAPAAPHATETRGPEVAAAGPARLGERVPTAPAIPAHSGHAGPGREKLAALALAALGVVYGDIGTSPLYALRECFNGPHAVRATSDNVLGVLSLITWSLIIIVTGKYLAFVMRADNHGEGGILALMALATRTVKPGTIQARIVVVLGVFGGTLLYGDGAITPAISVLSAVEGLSLITPMFDRWILPITLVIQVGLFVMQRRGTARVGRLFGPITLTWFIVLFLLGARWVAQNPAVLWSLVPTHALAFLLNNGTHALGVMGAVFLVVTGGEALYADMGHFGRYPIQLVWFTIVLPSLLINYMGQGALLLTDPDAASNPFYLLAPEWSRVPLVLLATAATVIASQALISGVFSLTQQAVQLGYWPRMEIIHTSAEERGQIYIPVVNWALLVGVVLLVLGFRTSSALAAAYGIALATTMIITALLAFRVARDLWKWPARWVGAITVLFLCIESAFFVANLLKVPDGAWVPLTLAVMIFGAMTTWKRGREVLGAKLASGTVPLDFFLQELDAGHIQRVRGTALFMTGNPDGAPPALLHNLKHNQVLHKRVITLTIQSLDVPTVSASTRVVAEKLREDFYRVRARYGFMESPNMKDIFARLGELGIQVSPMDTTFFLGRETLVPAPQSAMALWRTQLFTFMSRNARPPTQFFGIPPNRVVEMGAHIEL